MADYCGANRRGHHNAGTCRKPAGWGTSHAGAGYCRLHTGATPNGVKHAQVIIAERALEKLGLPVPSDPVMALQRAVDAANGLHIGLEALVREAATAEDARQLLPRLALYSDATDRLARVAKQAVDAGVTERRQSMSEETGRMVGEMVRHVIGQADIPEASKASIMASLAAATAAMAVQGAAQ